MLFMKPAPGASPTKAVARAGMVAAMYAVMTLIAPFTMSFGPLQFRLSEALMLLPLLTPDAIPGLYIGCLLANLLGSAVWFDVMLGSLATLLAAIFAYRWRAMPLLATFSPVLFNGLIVGPVVYFAYVRIPGDPVSIAALLVTIGTVALGEIGVCYLLGLPLYHLLRRLPESIFH